MLMDIVQKNYHDELKKIKKSKNIKLVDNDLYFNRLRICKKCKFYEKYNNDTEIFRCKKCGCAGFNILIKNFNCPLNLETWK